VGLMTGRTRRELRKSGGSGSVTMSFASTAGGMHCFCPPSATWFWRSFETLSKGQWTDSKVNLKSGKACGLASCLVQYLFTYFLVTAVW
jgi:hypothetical protein